jgi:methylmalonyl-CoA/ethylmalonyl-CoA epimerase
MAPIEGVVLDHVAVAVERQTDVWPRYVGDLAGRFLGGGFAVGFAPAQVAYANGMKVEVLEPHDTGRNDFLRRFLDRNGPGPHHLTFKVPDIEVALAAAADAGYEPVGVDLRDPHWKEAFIHPKQATGVVVQIAWAAGEFTEEARDMPPPRTDSPAALLHVAHAVADLDDGRRLFGGLLGGAEVSAGEGWVELAWPGAGRVRLLAAGAELDGKPGRVAHLTFACERPGDVPDARPTGDGTFVVEAADNFGARLMLWPEGYEDSHG